MAPRPDRPSRTARDTKESGDGGTTHWWIDQGKARERAPRRQPSETLAGAAFFRVGIGYDQETARSRLTDLNLKLIAEGNPPLGGWAHLQMTEDRFPQKRFDQIKQAVQVGPRVRALAVDSGVSMRVILTGEAVGNRLLELRFGDESSFDAWIRGEWMEEALFRRFQDAIRAAPDFVVRYLGPDSDRDLPPR